MAARLEALRRLYKARRSELANVASYFATQVKAAGVDEHRVPFKESTLDSFVAIGHDLVVAGYETLGTAVQEFGLRLNPSYKDPTIYTLITSAERLTSRKIKAIFAGREIIFSQEQYDLMRNFVNNPKKLQMRQKIRRIMGLPPTDLSNVRVAIARLRGKIEDDPSNPKYLTTRPREGIIFQIPAQSDNS